LKANLSFNNARHRIVEQLVSRHIRASVHNASAAGPCRHALYTLVPPDEYFSGAQGVSPTANLSHEHRAAVARLIFDGVLIIIIGRFKLNQPRREPAG